ncbi:MAG: sulfatase-like hydrolase/transferase, partial [Pirellulaceae bacterium]
MRSEQGKETPQGDGARQPWIVVHAEELDGNSDGIVTRTEMTAEATRAFTGYDADSNGRLSKVEYNGRSNVRSAMGGFIRGHANELDQDGDGFISKDEVLNNATRMFDRVDQNSDGKLTKDELQSAARSGDGRKEPRRRGDNRQPDDSRAVPTVPSNPIASSQSDRPNFVFILIDDMGWKDMGFSGNRFAETPNADQLAREGVIFTQAYANAPNCAPTRACLMSGQYTPRHRVFTVFDERHSPGQSHHRILASPSNHSMSGDVVTIPEALKTAGYATGCFGMWNLGRGRFGPSTATGQGFDVYKKPQDVGFDQSSYIDNEGRYLTDVLFDEGIRFIESNVDRPFFLYLPTHAIHSPFEPKADLLAKYERKSRQGGYQNTDPVYAAMIEAVDQNVGRLMNALRRLDLADNTMVVFTSDNGGTPRYVAPLKGSKGALYEGGIRVPAFIWWSGTKRPERAVSAPIASIDFYPTILEAAGVPQPTDHLLDGKSLLPILNGQDGIGRDALYWHFPCYIGRSSPCSAIRIGDFKLIEFFEDNHVELYNLKDDISESKNLALQAPGKTDELHTALIEWRRATNAPVPSEPNPSFDPSTLGKRKGQGGRGR